jgi:2-C-methyl-D-erythritol 2,4-cyclodiphosphate synthase
MRIGIGYDVHRLEPGLPLRLGGISIPHEKGLLGHSDADVLIHAICDALLGAIALGDIGQHFPDTSDEYKGIDSRILLERVNTIVENEGFYIENIDSTLILQRPRIKDFIPQMRAELAKILKIEIEQISVKATTTEKLGFEGREEGVAAQVACLLNEKK